MIIFKINVIEEMSKRGYTPTRIRDEKIIASQTMTNIRQGKPINTETLNKICLILRKQPGEILEMKATDEEKLKYF